MQNPHAPRMISLVWLRGGLVLAAWGLAALAVLVMAARVDLGPVVLKLSHNHGVHALDILAGVVATMGATIATVLILLFIPSHVLARSERRVQPREVAGPLTRTDS